MEYIWALLGLGFTLISGIFFLQVYIQMQLSKLQKSFDSELEQIKNYFNIKSN